MHAGIREVARELAKRNIQTFLEGGYEATITNAVVSGLELVELKESEVCCGSAGIYNVNRSEMGERLLEAKMRRVDETGAGLILTANPGWLLQLSAGVARPGQKRRVMRVMELLDEAYGRQDINWGGRT